MRQQAHFWWDSMVSQGNDLVACDLATKLMSNDVMTSLGWDNVTCDLAATWPKAR